MGPELLPRCADRGQPSVGLAADRVSPGAGGLTGKAALLRSSLSENHRGGVRWGEKADLQRSRFERCTREVKMKLYPSPSLDNGDRPCPILRPSSCL